jgi:hypothetical protein
MSNMEKVAYEVPSIMQAASQHLVKLAEKNVELVKRAEAAEHENRVMKLARRMEIRGLHTNLSFEEKVAQLMDVPLDKLATMEQAVEMAAGGVRLGKIAETNTGSKVSSSGYEPPSGGSSDVDELEIFIESQAAFI